MPLRLEHGAASVLATGMIAALLALTLLLVPLYTVLIVRQRVAGAADAAALAAADVAIGLAPGSVCSVAASVADANGTAMTHCQPDGVIVTVRVNATLLGFAVTATATAGPPGNR